MYHNTQGIVLKKIDMGESDALFSIYTKDFGLIRTLAQGVKKENAKLKGHLEVLNLCDTGFVSGRGGDRTTFASLINHWPDTRTNLNKLNSALYIVGLVHRNFLRGEKDGQFWEILLGSLRLIEGGMGTQKDLLDLTRNFREKLEESAGYVAI